MLEKDASTSENTKELFPIHYDDDGVPFLWVFGYGSLIWYPGFTFNDKSTATLKRYARRFYHGNFTFRGTAEKVEKVLIARVFQSTFQPGRVVTLIRSHSHVTHGMAYLLRGRKQIAVALQHLHEREVENGYEWANIIIHVDNIEGEVNGAEVKRLSKCAKKKQGTFVQVHALTCIAHAHSSDWLGAKSLPEMAEEIANAQGVAGPNTEYLFNLATHVRRLWPSLRDNHLFTLERLVLQMQSA